jgi:hypothetical protein
MPMPRIGGTLALPGKSSSKGRPARPSDRLREPMPSETTTRAARPAPRVSTPTGSAMPIAVSDTQGDQEQRDWPALKVLCPEINSGRQQSTLYALPLSELRSLVRHWREQVVSCITLDYTLRATPPGPPKW